MNPLIIFPIFIIAVQSRPEQSTGYNYPVPQGGFILDPSYTSGSSSSSSFSSGFEQNLEPVITKNVYVYVAPPDPQEQQIYQQQLHAPQKHYKIIFIKTPSIQQPFYQIPNIQQISEEKTLIYVLSKKPEEQVDLLQQLAAIQPSKPEVYFIRYKTKKGDSSISGSSGNVPSSIYGPTNGFR